MIVGHHGTRRSELPCHSGLCVAVGGWDDGYEAASDYARAAGGDPTVHEVTIDLSGLVVETVEVDRGECWDDNTWPGDDDRDEYLARGVDAIRFADATHTGQEHDTLRLLSERALAAIVSVEAYEPKE